MDHAPGGVWHAWYVMAGRMSLAGRGHRLGGGGLLDLDGALLLLPDLELGLAQGSLTSPAPARRGGRKGIGSVFEIALCMPFQCRVAIVTPSMASTSWIRHSIRMARLRATLVAATRRFRNLLSSFSRCVWHQVVGGDPWTDSGWCWCERLSPRGAPLPRALHSRRAAARFVPFRFVNRAHLLSVVAAGTRSSRSSNAACPWPLQPRTPRRGCGRAVSRTAT